VTQESAPTCIAAYLAVPGYELKQVVDTASKERGVDIIAEREAGNCGSR